MQHAPHSHTSFEARFSIAVDEGSGAELRGLDAVVTILSIFNEIGLLERGM